MAGFPQNAPVASVMARKPYVTVYLPGDPKGASRQRYRVVQTSGRAFATNYMPSGTKAYQEGLRGAGQIAMLAVRQPLDCPLAIVITATLSVPRSWPLTKQRLALCGAVRPTGRPDFDNLAKQIDALKGIVWRDDSLIVDATVRKVYGLKPSYQVDVWVLS